MKPEGATNWFLIGVGNSTRNDDIFGLEVARRIKALNPENVVVEECEEDGTALIDLWQGHKAVVLVDAVKSGNPPGTFFKLEAINQAIPASFFATSTHSFGVAEAIEVGRALGVLPPVLLVYGVEGKSFEMGTTLTPEMEAALEPLLARLRADLGF